MGFKSQAARTYRLIIIIFHGQYLSNIFSRLSPRVIETHETETAEAGPGIFALQFPSHWHVTHGAKAGLDI